MFEQFPDIVSIEQVMQMLFIGKSTAYSLLKSNKIRHVRVGRRYLIPKKSVISFVSNSCYNGDENQR